MWRLVLSRGGGALSSEAMTIYNRLAASDNNNNNINNHSHKHNTIWEGVRQGKQSLLILEYIMLYVLCLILWPAVSESVRMSRQTCAIVIAQRGSEVLH